jgi:hypothetical protein
LKARAQAHYAERLRWVDVQHWREAPSAWADVQDHTVSVMVEPPEGTAQIVVIRGRETTPLEPSLETAYRMAMELQPA